MALSCEGAFFIVAKEKKVCYNFKKYKGDFCMFEKIKKISKYTLNILTIINALLIGLDPIWGIPFADKVIATVSVIMAVISTYLLGNKAITKKKENATDEY